MAVDLRAERLRSLPPVQRELLLRMLRQDTAHAMGEGRIPRHRHDGPAPLSYAQRRLWFLARMNPASSAYNLPFALELEGSLRAEHLALSLSEIVRRHEVLRARFVEVDGRPGQVSGPECSLPLPEVDLRALAPSRREGESQRLTAAEARRPFDLGAGPLLRATLLRRQVDDHLLLLTMHHVASDAWSMTNLGREVATLYAAFSAGRPSPLPELSIQYADFASWQLERLDSEATAGLLVYWRARLAGAPAVLDLPADRPRPATQSFTGALRRAALAPALSIALARLARETGATPFMTFLAAFQVLLGRLTQQTDFLVGSPSANRSLPQLEPLIGFFVDTLVLRADLKGGPSFQLLLARTVAAVLADFDHRDLPFERLVDDLAIARSLSHNPLVQVVFALQNAPVEAPALPESLRVRRLPVATDSTQFDLTVAMSEEEGRLQAMAQFSTDLFDGTTVERLLGQLERLLTAVAAKPGAGIWEIPILAVAERHQLTTEWGGAMAAGASPRRGLHEMLAARVAERPDAVAASWEGGAISYLELERQAGCLATRLLQEGVRLGDLVGLSAERGPLLLVGILGILAAGCAYLPVDPAQPWERQTLLMRDAGLRTIVAEPETHGRLADGGARIVPLVPAAASDEVAGRVDRVRVDPSFPAYVIYTSGSTGRPKGTIVTHANVGRLFDAARAHFHFGAEDVWTLFHSYAFDFSVWELWGALLHGGRCVIVPYWVSRSPHDFAELLAREGVTVLNQTPSAFRQLDLAVDSAGVDLPSLRWVIFGGEALDPGGLRFWLARHGAGRPQLVNMYGITETTVHVTYRRLGRAEVEARSGSLLGAPLPDLAVYLLDRSGGPVPIGAAGELYVGGAGVASGYLASGALTAERFVPDPFGGFAGARLYRSGDLARWRAVGELEYLGRVDHQVKVRGFRIEPEEIAAVLRDHPNVRECVVMAREDTPGERRLVAYVVGCGGAPREREALWSHCRERLPEYMVPAVFVALPALPLTANGKLDPHALPPPGDDRAVDTGHHVAPRTPREEVLCGIWCQALGLAEVGVHDGFFTLGGDSILSLRVVALARERGLEIPLPDLFRFQTVAEMAVHLESPAAAAYPILTKPFDLVTPEDRQRLPSDLEDAYPLAAMQAGMLYHLELTPIERLYHNVDSWRVRGRFEAVPFRRAIDRVVSRHPMLRTSFDLVGYSEPLQLVHRNAVLPLVVEDLRHLSADEQQCSIARLIAGQKQCPFDLSRPPQLRFHVGLRAEDEFQFSVTENHAIFDGWSLHATLAEIFQLYFALLAGEEPAEEAPPALTYRDFVQLERQALESREAAAFWNGVLSDSPPCDLPPWTSSWLPPPGRERIGAIQPEVSPARFESLRVLARQAAVPLKSVFLSAHLKVLSLLGGRSEVLSGVVMNGRPEGPEGDQVRGLFLNTLPFRFDLGTGTWMDLARRVFMVEGELLAHRRYPLAALQRRRGQGDLIEVAFHYIHFHVVQRLMRAGDLEVLGLEGAEGTSFKLLVTFIQNPVSGELALSLQYDAHRLPGFQMRSIAALYGRVLAAMADDPTALHHELSPLVEAERHRLLLEWNDTAVIVGEHTVHGLFALQAARAPDAVAVDSSGLAITYGELERRSSRLAQRLERRGVARGQLVGLLLDRSAELPLVLLAVLKAGGAYLPLDPTSPQRRLSDLLADARVSLVLTEPRLCDRLTILEPGGAPAPSLLVLEPGEEVVSGDGGNLPGATGPEDLAYVMFTSGSTGRPKGVAVPHRAVVRLVHRSDFADLGSDQVSLQLAPLAFDASTFEIWGALLNGGRLAVAPPGLPSLEDLGALIQSSGATLLWLTASLFHQVVDSQPECLDPLRQLLAGGEALSVPHVRRALDRLPRTRLSNGYGPTENTTFTCCSRLCDQAVDGETVPIGRPIANTRVYVVGPDGRLVPAGVRGELWTGGEGLSWGYLHRPELTADQFVPDPFGGGPGARLYRTGDLVRRLPSGDLEFLGRIDRQVKLRGHRIEPEEIEAALRAHPAVREAAVLARAERGGELRLVAYVAAAAGHQPSWEELRTSLREHLPAPMVPAAFVAIDEFPLGPNGKLDREALGEMRAEALSRVVPYVAPAPGLEARIAAVWRDVLGTDEVGAQDNFFDLGGHSLTLLQVQKRLRALLAREVPMVELFRSPTVAALARRLADSAEDADPAREGRGRGQARRELRRRRTAPAAAPQEDGT